MMNIKLKRAIEEDLQKATSKLAVEIILSHNATQEDIEAGVYEPINKISSFLNLEEIFARQEAQKAKAALNTSTKVNAQ